MLDFTWLEKLARDRLSSSFWPISKLHGKLFVVHMAPPGHN